MQLSELAQRIGAELFNPSKLSSDVDISAVLPLDKAHGNSISFLTQAKFVDALKATKAAAVILAKSDSSIDKLQLIHPNPYAAMAKAAQLFFGYEHTGKGHSAQAHIDPSARVHPTATVYPYAFIDADVEISEDVVVYPHSFIGKGVRIGKGSTLFAGVVVNQGCQVGERVIVHPRTVIGADGFGFAPTKEGIEKIPQQGIVVIEDDVEIGSLSNIDRATFDKTLIKKGTKIDSMVHIGHNATIGNHTMLCAQVGIAGSAVVGSRCILAGNSGVAHGIKVSDGAILGSKCGAVTNLENPGEYHGFPGRPAKEWRRSAVVMNKLPELLKRVQRLEKQLSER